LKFISNYPVSGFEIDVSNKKIPNLEKYGSNMIFILQIGNNYEKYERGYCYLAHAEKKPLSVSKEYSLFSQKSPRKKTGRNGQKNIF
jgi:hypothetical protein